MKIGYEFRGDRVENSENRKYEFLGHLPIRQLMQFIIQRALVTKYGPEPESAERVDHAVKDEELKQ